jgi:acyl-CoA dehydrogenase
VIFRAEEGEFRELIAVTREFVERELAPHEADVDRSGEIPEPLVHSITEKAVASGLYAFNMPAEAGGPGLPQLAQVMIREQIGRSSVALGSLIARPPKILAHCSGNQRARFLQPAVTGEKRVAFALTEPGAGSDAGSLSTKAELVDGGFLLKGRKQFVSHGSSADLLLVFARSNEGVSAFIVERGAKGISIGQPERTLGWRGYPLVEIAFDDCFVPADHLIGEEGRGLAIALSHITDARLGVAAHCVGTASRALEMAVDYVAARVAFGSRVADFQGVRWMLADMNVKLEGARSMVYAAARAVDAGHDVREWVAMAKLASSEAAGEIVDTALQLFGGSGYIADNPIERMYRDIRAFRIGEGTSEIQREEIARRLLRRRGV